MRKECFVMGVVGHWDRLSKEIVDAPSLPSVQGQVGQGSEQPGLEKDAPGHGRVVGLDDLSRSLPTHTTL